MSEQLVAILLFVFIIVAFTAIQITKRKTEHSRPKATPMPRGEWWSGVVDHQRWTKEGHEHFSRAELLDISEAKWQLMVDAVKEVKTKHLYIANDEPGDWWGKSGFDCQGFALAFKEAMLDKGAPPGALRLATCKTNNGYHAVCLVFTNEGAYAMDNMSSVPTPWESTGYTEWAVESINGTWQLL